MKVNSSSVHLDNFFLACLVYFNYINVVFLLSGKPAASGQFPWAVRLRKITVDELVLKVII